MATVSVFRFDPELDERGYFDDFHVPDREGQTVLEALFHILEHEDGSIGFRYACRGAVCGSCAMHINGRYRLSCATQMADLGEKVVIRPLYHMPVIRDLVVDMDGFFEKYERLRPWLVNETPLGDKERLQSPEDRAKLDKLVDCILCACCQASCPFTQTDPEYIGPALLLKLDRFYSDSRDLATADRIEAGDSEHGVWRCHTAYNCIEVCPKDLNPTASIARLKGAAIRRQFTGRVE
jgi:succinate dehydrogenase / fumarate reductase iron-sulfur subunit